MQTMQARLTQILEGCTDTAQFLEAVQRAVEALYADSADGCPAGFTALDSAIEAFRAADELER